MASHRDRSFALRVIRWPAIVALDNVQVLDIKDIRTAYHYGVQYDCAVGPDSRLLSAARGAEQVRQHGGRSIGDTTHRADDA